MRRVLIVVDMQNDFINGSLGSEETQKIVDNVKNKIELYNQNGDSVIFTKDTHYENYLDTQEGKNLPVKHCIKDSNGWKISDCLNVGNSKIFEKNTFGSVELADFLKQQGDLKEIELVGLCTDICVVSNALLIKAVLPEAVITVDAECCAGVSVESHNAALLTMKMCHIGIINSNKAIIEL